VIVTVVGTDTTLVAMVKSCEKPPGGTLTVAGGTASGELLVIVTAAPALGAAPFRPTNAEATAPPVIWFGEGPTSFSDGGVTVIDFASEKIIARWAVPGGGSPDMGNVSADGRYLWLSGRYDARIYEISTVDGHLIAQVRIPNKPHGMCVWPQPGRFSLGHTGDMR